MDGNKTRSLFAADAVGESPPASNNVVSPGTDSGPAPGVDPAAPPYPPAPLSPSSSASPVTFTTTMTAITAGIGGGGSGGGGSAGKGKWNSGETDTDDILPWILCFGIGLILIWIGWMLRQYINRRCCGGEGGQRAESNRNVHWQWISTGNPHSGSLLPRTKTQAAVDTKVDLTEVDPAVFNILIGGDMTPGSGMTPNVSQAMISSEQQSLTKNDFNHLLGRVCSISDPAQKMQTFELTFDNIQLGSWSPDEWQKFTHKLLAFHPKVNTILETKNGHVNKRSVLDEWLNWQTVEKADMRDIYVALEAADKVDVAHNAAISVTLELRQAAGRITSECVDLLSESSDGPNNEELEILEEEDEDDEEDDDEDLTPTNSVKAAFSPNRRNHQHQRSNHDQDQRSNRDLRTPSDRAASPSSGVGENGSLAPEEHFLNASPSTTTSATATKNGTLRDNQSLHLNRSPAHQGSLNDSDGNQDTVHSTERLIHV